MKITRIESEAPKTFEPITVQIVIESREEVFALREASANLCIGTVNKEVSTWERSRVIVGLLEIIYSTINEG